MDEITRKEFLKRFAVMGAGSLFLSGCPEYGVEPAYGVLPPDVEDDDPDDTGNLIVRNNTGERLVLYSSLERLKIMPANSRDYLVNVPDLADSPESMVLHVLEHVVWDLDAPYEYGLRNWTIELPEVGVDVNPAIWIVRHVEETAEIFCGSFTFSNHLNSDVSVDVFINSRNGAKLAVIQPLRSQIVGLEHGSYFFFFRYWNADGELGWIDTVTIDGEEKPIYAILNDDNNMITVDIPIWDPAT